MLIRNTNDPTGNRSRYLSVSDGVPQLTAPTCACVVAGFLHGDLRECILIELARGRYFYDGMKKMHNYVLMILVITLL